MASVHPGMESSTSPPSTNATTRASVPFSSSVASSPGSSLRSPPILFVVPLPPPPSPSPLLSVASEEAEAEMPAPSRMKASIACETAGGVAFVSVVRVSTSAEVQGQHVTRAVRQGSLVIDLRVHEGGLAPRRATKHQIQPRGVLSSFGVPLRLAVFLHTSIQAPFLPSSA